MSDKTSDPTNERNTMSATLTTEEFFADGEYTVNAAKTPTRFQSNTRGGTFDNALAYAVAMALDQDRKVTVCRGLSDTVVEVSPAGVGRVIVSNV